MVARVTEGVRRAIVAVCRDAFHWRDDPRGVFLDAGCPVELYDRHWVPENSKARIARLVLDELRARGDAGNQVVAKIVQELCRMDRPQDQAPDPAKGRQALADLKREATKTDLLIDPQQAAVKDRQSRADQKLRAQRRRQERLGDLREKFFGHLRERPRTPAERQQRGYALEQILIDLFQAYEIEYRKPYRNDHEQVDGSFHFRGFTYIVESKWESQPPDFGDLAKFKANVDGKAESTRGLFVAMSGFDENVLDHAFNTMRNSRNNLVLMDGQDLIAIFEGRISLDDALVEKVNAAEQEGKPWLPLGR